MLAAQCNKLSSKSPPPLADAAVGKGFHPWKKSPTSPSSQANSNNNNTSTGSTSSNASVGQHSPCAISASSASSTNSSGGNNLTGICASTAPNTSRTLPGSGINTMVNITAR